MSTHVKPYKNSSRVQSISERQCQYTKLTFGLNHPSPAKHSVNQVKHILNRQGRVLWLPDYLTSLKSSITVFIRKRLAFVLPLHAIWVEFLNNAGELNSQILLKMSTKGIAYLLSIFWNSVPSLLCSLWDIRKKAPNKRQYLPIN